MAPPLPAKSPVLLARLQAYGGYSFHWPSLLGRWIGIPVEIEWESPAGFENGLAPIVITLWFPPKKAGDAELTRLLDRLDAFQRHLADHLQDLESLVLQTFREGYERELTDLVRERLAGGCETISDAAILREVTAVHFRFDATGRGIVYSAWVVGEWTGADGITVEWDELASTSPPPRE